MQTDHVKVALTGAWIIAIGAFGYGFGATSVAAWTALTVLSLAPAVIMARLWKAPAPSMSESIHDVLH